MREIKHEPSRTAAGVAWLRAAHQVVDEPPRILDDPIAPRLLGEAGRRALGERRAELFQPGALALRSHVLLRSRYAEDRLELAARQGVDQFVVLGAGLDTFAYRQPDWAASMRIFEVDQPGSQLVKRDRVALAGIEVRGNLAYVPVDFESADLLTGLVRGGVDPARPAFVSWLGVRCTSPARLSLPSSGRWPPCQPGPSWCSPSRSRARRARHWRTGRPPSASHG